MAGILNFDLGSMDPKVLAFLAGGTVVPGGQAAPNGSAAATAGAPAGASSAAEATQSGQELPPGMTPEQAQAMIAQARPGILGTVFGALGRKGSFDQVRDQITQEHLARQMLPYQIAQNSQALAYRQNLDPSLRYLAVTNPTAFADVMKSRLSPHDTAGGAITTGLGANGDRSVYGSVASKPGESVGFANGQVVQKNPAAPFSVAPSNSVASGDTGQIMSTAPAAPQVVTTSPGQGVSVVNPNGGTPPAPGIPGPGGPPAAAGAPQSGGAQVPRGIRNNNPWNLTNLGKGMWQGQTGRDGDMAVFATPQAGAAAADRNLQAKFSLHGLNTLQGLIADPKWGWDPGNQTYVHTVSADLGVPPGQALNLQDPSVRARVLDSMKKVEVGKFAAQAPNAPGALSGPGAGGPATPIAGGTARQVVAPTMARQATPQEAIAAGKPLGAWEILPDGTWKLQAQPNKDELARVNGMTQAAQALEDVTGLDREFLAVNRRSSTGLQYAGEHWNPIGDIAAGVNPDVGKMEDLANRETLAFRPQGVGRILQAEIPMFRASALDPGRTLGVNQSIAEEHSQTAALLRAKANFYQDWLYTHGNLAGADQAWGRQEAQSQPSAPAPRQGAAGKPPQRPPQPAGWKITPVQ